jgi:4-hydroxybenzoate polyprenyltransferase
MLRPHQWLKNLLLLVPALAAHRLDWPTWQAGGLAFVSFSLCASGGYVFNDLLDAAADRLHHRKRHRPIASGRVAAPVAVAIGSTLCGGGVMLAYFTLPVTFAAVIAIYLAATASYSLRLKREPVLDVMFLAGLYVIRVVGGGIAMRVPVSSWLLTFTLFVCLSLAFLKRYIEVHALRSSASASVPGRGYEPDDESWLQAAGLTSAYLSVLILAIYVNSDDVTVLYAYPERLLFLSPVLLFWSTRTWFYASRRLLHDDPLVALVLDPVTYALVTLCAVILVSAA